MALTPAQYPASQIVVRDNSGEAQEGVSLSVYTTDENGDDDALAILYDDSGVEIDNPVETDVNGTARFRTLPGIHNLSAVLGSGTKRWDGYRIGLASAYNAGDEEMSSLLTQAEVEALIDEALEGVIKNPNPVLTGIASGTATVQTSTDTTVGRLLKVGYMGLGTTTPSLIPGNDINGFSIPTGIFRVDSSTTAGTLPPGATVSDVVVVLRRATNQTTQIYSSPGTNQTWIRESNAASNWRPWRLLWDSTNLNPNALSGVTVPTGNTTLAIGAAGSLVRMNVATANTVTVPPNSSVAFPIGTVVQLRQTGAGQTSIVAGAGVTINTPETYNLRKQGSMAALIKVGTNEWDLTGDLEVIV